MNHEIHNLLARIERHHGVCILYACESGSRAWGFASPDSDQAWVLRGSRNQPMVVGRPATL
jgi:hypothetical protein